MSNVTRLLDNGSVPTHDEVAAAIAETMRPLETLRDELQAAMDARMAEIEALREDLKAVTRMIRLGDPDAPKPGPPKGTKRTPPTRDRRPSEAMIARVMEGIEKNPDATGLEVARAVGIGVRQSSSGVYKTIQWLRDEGLIRRSGSRKVGNAPRPSATWRVVDDS